MTKSEILASTMPPVEKVWLIASQRSDIRAGSFGVESRFAADESYVYLQLGDCRCPLGAVLFGEHSTGDEYHDAASLLGVSYQWAVGFALGFDRKLMEREADADGYTAGKEIRVRFEAVGVDLG